MIIKNETANNIRLVQLIANEAEISEMADVFGITPLGVYKRVERLRNKYDKKTNAGLVVLFINNKLVKT